MNTIAMYDVTGIQGFIFASGKVKENVGASIIVQKVFDDDCFRKAIQDVQAKLIYAGGGNAMVSYQSRDDAIYVTQKLSCDILSKTGGALKFAVAYQDTKCDDFLKDKDELIRKLKICKYRMPHQTPLLGIGLTREGHTDGLPAMFAIEEDNNKKYISKSARFKRNEYESGYFDDLLPNTTDYEFPLEFDDLGQTVGENHIALVHIDGNNMGKMLNDLLNAPDYQQSIQTMREFSKQVDKKYQAVMKHLVQKLADGLKDADFHKKLRPVSKEEKWLLPIRPIVRSGDDVTFVCNGKIGIALAEEFLTKLDKNSEIHVNGKKVKLSACAGVAIVKSHFPFYRAYQLAEELCKSAKMKGKILAKINDAEEIGNWLDFHIVQSGVTNSLNEIRNKFYQVPGMERPDELIYEEDGDVQMKLKQYNLLWRPWCIAGKTDQKYLWNLFQDIDTEFTREKKKNEDEILWKRSRLKKLESEIARSEYDAQSYIRECKSRGFRLPECLGSSDLYRERQTPYFDALELLDFYVEFPKAEEKP